MSGDSERDSPQWKIRIPTNTMEQEFQKHYSLGYNHCAELKDKEIEQLKATLTLYSELLNHPEITEQEVSAWKREVEAKAIEECIKTIATFRVSVGNSCSGELAAEWTMQNLREMRNELEELAQQKRSEVK